ncbi:MAG: hypothetical protein A2Y25_04985 [Candidatus Melainabacteria bacterium GWF2_37_15]|nr:MAG: hypothetical protein A2Y25_04985 [Candidatus Melainabacteria bacterium GWF2_37_15]
MQKFKEFKLFGLLNAWDITIVAFIIITLLAVFLVKKGKMSASSEIIHNLAPIEIDVLLTEEKITHTQDLFVPGGKTFITIRNVPYTELEIIKSEKTPWPPNNEEPSYKYTFDYLVTVTDTAVITPDGPVIGGNKIKIGLPIMLEGSDYKLSGVVTDIRIDKK